VHAHQPRLLGAHRLVLGALCLLAIQADAQGEGGDHKDQDAANGDLLGIHDRVFRRYTSRKATMAVKASSDSHGIWMSPRITSF